VRASRPRAGCVCCCCNSPVPDPIWPAIRSSGLIPSAQPMRHSMTRVPRPMPPVRPICILRGPSARRPRHSRYGEVHSSAWPCSPLRLQNNIVSIGFPIPCPMHCTILARSAVEGNGIVESTPGSMHSVLSPHQRSDRITTEDGCYMGVARKCA
jgi:hypothetical protein